MDRDKVEESYLYRQYLRMATEECRKEYVRNLVEQLLKEKDLLIYTQISHEEKLHSLHRRHTWDMFFCYVCTLFILIMTYFTTQ